MCTCICVCTCILCVYMRWCVCMSTRMFFFVVVCWFVRVETRVLLEANYSSNYRNIPLPVRWAGGCHSLQAKLHFRSRIQSTIHIVHIPGRNRNQTPFHYHGDRPSCKNPSTRETTKVRGRWVWLVTSSLPPPVLRPLRELQSMAQGEELVTTATLPLWSHL